MSPTARAALPRRPTRTASGRPRRSRSRRVRARARPGRPRSPTRARPASRANGLSAQVGPASAPASPAYRLDASAGERAVPQPHSGLYRGDPRLDVLAARGRLQLLNQQRRVVACPALTLPRPDARTPRPRRSRLRPAGLPAARRGPRLRSCATQRRSGRPRPPWAGRTGTPRRG